MNLVQKLVNSIKLQLTLREYIECKSRRDYHQWQAKYFIDYPSGNNLQYHQSEVEHYESRMLDINDKLNELQYKGSLGER